MDCTICATECRVAGGFPPVAARWKRRPVEGGRTGARPGLTGRPPWLPGVERLVAARWPAVCGFPWRERDALSLRDNFSPRGLCPPDPPRSRQEALAWPVPVWPTTTGGRAQSVCASRRPKRPLRLGLPTISQRFLKRACNPASRGEIRPHDPPPAVEAGSRSGFGAWRRRLRAGGPRRNGGRRHGRGRAREGRRTWPC